MYYRGAAAAIVVYDITRKVRERMCVCVAWEAVEDGA